MALWPHVPVACVGNCPGSLFGVAGVATSSLLSQKTHTSRSQNKIRAKASKDSSREQAESTHPRIHQFDVFTHHTACTRGIFLCVLAACSSHARLPSASPLSRPNRVDAAGEDRDAKTRHDVSPSCLPLPPTSPKHTRRSQEAMPGPRLLSHAHSSLLLDLCCVRTHSWT